MDDFNDRSRAISVSITRGWRPVTGIRGDGLAVVSPDGFALHDGAGRQLAWAPLYQVRADYTRFLWHTTISVWIAGVRYVLGRGGPPSAEQVRQLNTSIAIGANPAGAALRGLGDQRDFARQFHDLFTAAGGRWGRPARLKA